MGASIGSQVGKLTFPLLAGTIGGVVGRMIFGPVGAVVGSVLGTSAGALIEKQTSGGKIAGGMTGGYIGMQTGKSKEKERPQGLDADEKDRKYSLDKLFSKLQMKAIKDLNPMSEEDKKIIKDNARPGDVIITTSDEIDVEILQKALGGTANWVHASFVTDETNTVEMVATGFQKSTIKTLIDTNQHAMILRPSYSSEENKKKAIEEAKNFEGADYDFMFNIESDNRLYCTELVYKALKSAQPDIDIEPASFHGYKVVSADELIKSPDMNIVASTGSHFEANFFKRYQQ